jgi:hypothetical protein
METCVESRLTATSLAFVVMNAASCFFQYLNGIEGCFRIKLVHETGDEKLYVHVLVEVNQ